MNAKLLHILHCLSSRKLSGKKHLSQQRIDDKKKTLETRNFKEREIYSDTEYFLIIPLKLGSGKI